MVTFNAAFTYLFHPITKVISNLLVLQEISSTEDLEFLDEIESVNKEAKKLKEQGADIIIALSHGGLDVDREVAAAAPDVDIIVGGHSHSFLYTGKLRTG
jgi:5'-nucleotidase